MEATAPVPSPRCRLAVMSGALPKASSTIWAAGSAETWLANTALAAAGQSRTAHRAATLLIKPSIKMGTPSSAPPKNTPHSPAISNPPSLASTSSGSAGLGWLWAMPRRIASILRASPASESPAPRPVMLCTGAPSSTLATALEVVVLPMPISPVANS